LDKAAMPKTDIFVIGGSKGSGEVLRRMVGGLPQGLTASVFVTTHIPAHGNPYMLELLSKRSPLPIVEAEDGRPIEPGHIYMAVPDRHLMVSETAMLLGVGPRENMCRPSIDPLFRSAAQAFGPRAVGVILTGMLNDGAAGLATIKACGGLAVVQHPADAVSSEMPLAALGATEVDHLTTGDNLAELLATLAEAEAGPGVAPPRDLQLEIDIAAGRYSGSDMLQEIADPVATTCPECRGALSYVRESRPMRFRCQIGHAVTADHLFKAQERGVEAALGIALRVMEERAELVERMKEDARRQGRRSIAELWARRAREYRGHAETLRKALRESLQKPAQPEEATKTWSGAGRSSIA
jgi:two-component system chemotaxis response regulator CheB